MYMYVFNILRQTLHIRLLFVYGKINVRYVGISTEKYRFVTIQAEQNRLREATSLDKLTYQYSICICL